MSWGGKEVVKWALSRPLDESINLCDFSGAAGEISALIPLYILTTFAEGYCRGYCSLWYASSLP